MAAIWLNTHTTLEELDQWVLQARGLSPIGKNYKNPGDVVETGYTTSNSPGDWARFVKNTNDFMLNPAKDRWVISPNKTTAITDMEDSTFQPHGGEDIRDAAFVYLIKKRAEDLGTPIATTYSTSQLLAAVRTELLWQASERSTDFSNTARWATDVLSDKSPAFWHAIWASRYFFAFEYISAGLNQTDTNALLTWHKNAATYFQKRNVDVDLNKLFKDRQNGNYTLSGYANLINVAEAKTITFFGGDDIPRLAKWYNNRRASMMQYVTLVGVRTGDASMIKSGKLFVKEWLKYSVFPNGTIGELERWGDDASEQGYQYSLVVLDQVGTIMDVLARKGDFELYNFSTSEGLFATQGGVKSFKSVVDRFMSFVDGSFVKYETKDAAKVGNNNYKLDGNDQINNRYYAFDTWMCQYNLYWKDDNLKAIYTRAKNGTTPYKASGAVGGLGSMGGKVPWQGGFSVYPGKLFMYGQKENRVDPYSKSKTPQTITLEKPADKVYGDAPFILVGKAPSGLAVAFAVVSGPATIAGAVVTLTGAGEVRVRATQPGDATYDPAPAVEQTFQVKKKAQIITFAAIANKQISVSAPFNIVATSDSGLPVALDLIEGPGLVTDGLYTLQGIGDVTIRATQAGNANYLPATALTRSFVVLAAPIPPVTNLLAGLTGVSTDNGSSLNEGDLTDGQVGTSVTPTIFYLVWDLGTNKQINKIVVKFRNLLPSVKVQVWNGSSWVDKLSVSGNANKLVEANFDFVQGSKIRLITYNKSWRHNVGEVEVYGY